MNSLAAGSTDSAVTQVHFALGLFSPALVEIENCCDILNLMKKIIKHFI